MHSGGTSYVNLYNTVLNEFTELVNTLPTITKHTVFKLNIFSYPKRAKSNRVPLSDDLLETPMMLRCARNYDTNLIPPSFYTNLK